MRAPLAAIKTNLQVLQRTRSADEREEFIAGLGASMERATRLVNQLLALAQLDPQAPCALDADSLQILLRNLVGNALRYTPAPGCVVLSCGVEQGGSYLRVADTGPCIAAEMHERVSERCVRLGGGQLPGSGLGLSIVRRIAERHGAQIALGAGLPGRGPAVTLVFPAA